MQTGCLSAGRTSSRCWRKVGSGCPSSSVGSCTEGRTHSSGWPPCLAGPLLPSTPRPSGITGASTSIRMSLNYAALIGPERSWPCHIQQSWVVRAVCRCARSCWTMRTYSAAASWSLLALDNTWSSGKRGRLRRSCQVLCRRYETFPGWRNPAKQTLAEHSVPPVGATGVQSHETQPPSSVSTSHQNAPPAAQRTPGSSLVRQRRDGGEWRGQDQEATRIP